MEPASDPAFSPRIRLAVGTGYLIIIVAALTAFLAVQLGWRPRWISLWDGRARLVATSASALVFLLAVVGALQLVPVTRLPRWLRVALGNGVAGAAAGAVLAGLALSPASTAATSWPIMARGLVFGFAGFAAVALLDLIPTGKAEEGASPRARQFVAIGLIGILVALGGFDLLRERPRDDGKEAVVARFASGEDRLEVAIGDIPLTHGHLGVLRIAARGRTNALVQDRDEWRQLTEAIDKTLGATPQVFAVVKDRTPSDRGVLTISRGGATLHFDLSSQRYPRVTFDLPVTEVPRFKAALDGVARGLMD